MHPSISERIADTLDPTDATPLYHQLATVVRWEIAHGRLPIGAVLPSLREISAVAGVNYHTVRRAWAELEAEGVISQRRGRGGRVIRAPQRSGWTPAGSASEGGTAVPRVWVVAGSLESAAALAEALRQRWQVEAIPWPLEADSPPPGRLVSTAAVREEALMRWPNREGDLRAIATVLSQATIGVLRRNAALLGVKHVEIHGGADTAARELARQLPRLGLQATLAPGTGSATSDALLLYFPEAWRGLDWSSRMHPRVLAAELGWAAGPLAGVAREQGWAVVAAPATR